MNSRVVRVVGHCASWRQYLSGPGRIAAGVCEQGG